MTSPVHTSTDRAPLLFDYLLRLGDSPLILAQRLGEWIGKAPVLEEELANANIGLDLLGQARLWLAYAGEVEARYSSCPRDADALAFTRDAGEFRNVLLVERPNGNFADTLMRQFLFDTWHLRALQALSGSGDSRIADIAAKSVKEVTYHSERSGDWIIRLGDGTEESHVRAQRALDALWTYSGEMFMNDAVDQAMLDAGCGVDLQALLDGWREHVGALLREATLTLPPADTYMQGAGGRGGKQGVHTEALGHLLPEMQFLQRAYPGARW
ncbi:MAG: phenylacetate-CoA oxygenase subunit PaaC [Pseudomonadota bacterium]|nr:phenylacetate-CoA oxygenase subunit PaaC [Pseudomonadota bacterium]